MKLQQTICVVFLLLVTSIVVAGQGRPFTSDGIDYVLELPAPAWQVVSRSDVHEHLEFINGKEPTNGYLRVRKILVEQPTTTTDLFNSQEKWELRRLPGYVVCGACEGVRFEGRLSGAVFSYEYVSSGSSMYGRIYYLQADPRTFYSLQFTVASEKLPTIREQMESIAGSFYLKKYQWCLSLFTVGDLI